MEDCTYSPQISPGSPLTPMPATAPTLTPRDTILLEYPFVSPTTTLELRNPNFNDKLVVRKSRIYRVSRGNDLIVFKDPIWPKTRIINYAFERLTQVQAQDALDFFEESLGKYIKLTTYESLVYKGIIINPNNPVSQETKSLCSFTLKFDFQGQLV